MDAGSLLLQFQEFVTCPFPEPDHSSPCSTSHFPFLKYSC